MRLIPKKTKLDSTIWKSLTLIDILLLFALFLLGVVIILSNLPGKWFVIIGYVPLCVLLFIPSDDGKVYKDIIHMVKYLFSHKHYTRASKRASKNVAALVPDYKLEEDGVLDYGSYKAAVIAVGSLEFSLLSVYQQNEKISAFATAFNMLAENEAAQIVKIDRPINFDEISGKTYNKLVALEKTDDAAKKLIMRRRLSQLDNLNNVEKLYRPYYYIVLYSPTRAALDVLVGNVLQALSDAGLATYDLTTKEVCTFLKYCFARDFDERDIEDVPPEKYVDYITPNEIKFTKKNYSVDGKSAFTFAVRDYPLTVGNAWGADIFNIDNTKVVLTVKPVERNKAIRRIDKTIVEIGSRSGGSKASEMIAQDTHLETMGALLQSLQNENEALFDCTLTVTGFNNTEMSDTAFRRAVRQRLTTAGFKPSLLRYRQLDGYVSSSISARTALKSYSRGINSESLAAVFPFVFTSIIEPEGITLGESGGYPFVFDPWKWQYSGGEFYNSNMFVAGMPGSGKSYFAKSYLSQMYSENTRIYILDPENEYKHLCRNVDGSFIDVGSATAGRINPFHIYQTLGELEDENGNPLPPYPQATFAAHLQYLDNFFSVTLPGISSDTLEEINNLVVKCYEKKGITQDTDCQDFAADRFPIFDDLYKLVVSELKTEKNGIRFSNLQRAQTYLEKFATGGRFANLWNGPSTLEQTDKFTVFNFQSLFEAKNKVTSNGQMLTVLRFLEQQIINLRKLNENKPRSEWIHPIVVLDEGYMFIDAKNTCALDFVFQWYKRIRKYGGSMIFLTQNLADIVGNAEIISKTSAIINNTQYSFIMTLQGKDIEVLQDIFAARNLTEAEIEEIQRTNKPKGTAFFMGSSAQRAMLHVVTDGVIETLFSRTVDVEQLLEARYASEETVGELAAPNVEERTQKESLPSDVDIPQGAK